MKYRSGVRALYTGNSDGNTIKYTKFPEPIFLRKIRFYVEKWENKIAMRVGIYGCYAETFDQPFPAVELRLGDDSSALNNPKIGETLLPAKPTDFTLTRIYVPPSTGRYLSVATRKTNQQLRLCKVSAYNNERKNMAVKKQVILQESAFDSSAAITAKAATDSKISQLEHEATGQVCVIGQPGKLINDVNYGIGHQGFGMGGIPSISCNGIVAQWSYITAGRDRATREIYFSTWNNATKERQSFQYALDTSCHSIGRVNLFVFSLLFYLLVLLKQFFFKN